MESKVSDSSASPQDKQRGRRSPNFPSVSLKVAVEKISGLYKKAETHKVPLETAASIWDYTVKSSSFLKLLGALVAYGLVDCEGSGTARRINVSKDGERIVDEGPGYEDLLRTSAMRPKLFKKTMDKYSKNGRLPSDSILRDSLRWDEEFQFNKETIARFIRNLNETIAYAKLKKDAILASRNEEKGIDKEAPVSDDEPLKVGDYVQWCSQGVDQYKTPQPIVGFYDKDHAIVAGSQTGVPVSELTKWEHPGQPNKSQQIPKPDKNNLGSQLGTQTMKQYSIPVGGGADAVLFVPQPMTAKMYGKLKTVIDLYEDVLIENEDDQAQGSSSPTPDDDQKE